MQMTAQEDLSWYSGDIATFGDRVAGARENAGMSQEELSHRLGVKLTTLCNWEDDLNEPRSNKLQMLSGVLGVSLGWLLTGEGPGLTAPDAVARLDPDIEAILADMRKIRSELAQATDRLSLLEKGLRARLKEIA